MRYLYLSMLLLVQVVDLQAQDTLAIAGCDDLPLSAADLATCQLICTEAVYVGTTETYTPSPNAEWCGTIENDQYIGFIAPSTGTTTFEITAGSCVNQDGIQVGLYNDQNRIVGDCQNQLFPDQPQIFAAGGMTPGELYYLRIDGYAGDLCAFYLTVFSGLANTPTGSPGPIYGPQNACWDEYQLFAIDPVPNATSYYWQFESGPWLASAAVYPPEAFDSTLRTNQLEVGVELPEYPADMPAGTCDTFRLSVVAYNDCFGFSLDSSIIEVSVCAELQGSVSLSVCPGDSLEYPLGSGEYYLPAATPYYAATGVGPLGCDGYTWLTVSETAALPAVSLYDSVGIAIGSAPVLAASDTLVWYVDGVPVASGASFSYPLPVDSSVTVGYCVRNACAEFCDSVLLSGPLSSGSEELAHGASLKVWPNPVEQTLHWQFDAMRAMSVVRVRLHDVLGRDVWCSDSALGANGGRLELAHLPAGRYTLRLTTTAGEVVRGVVVR